MFRILIVDDEAVRVPTLLRYAEILRPDEDIETTHVTTVPENSVFADYDMVFLDHDLGVFGGDVYEVMRRRFFAYEPLGSSPVFIIHSMNPIGAGNLARLLVDYEVPRDRVHVMNYGLINSMVRLRDG